MAAIELSDWQQVESGGQHANECGAGDRMQKDIALGNTWEQNHLHQTQQWGRAKDEIPLMANPGNDFR
jgi:hypothetical protein